MSVPHGLPGKAYVRTAFGCVGAMAVIALFVVVLWGLGVMAGPR